MEFKSTEVKRVYLQFTTTVQPALMAFYKVISNKHSTFVNDLEKRYALLNKALKQSKDQSEKVELQREFKKELLDLLTRHCSVLTEVGFNKFYADFEDVVKQEFGDLKRIIRIKEPFDGYSISLKNNPFINIRKIFVNLKRFTILFLKRIANFFRRIFRRKPLELVVYRKRRVLFRTMAKEFVQNQFLNETKHLTARIMESQSKGLIDIWILDDSLDLEFQKTLAPDNTEESLDDVKDKSPTATFKKIKSEHLALVKTIEEEAESIGENMFKLFDDAFQKVDTLDLSYRKFNSKKLDESKRNVIYNYNNELAQWKNTHTALIDDWSVDVEITLLYYSAFDEFNFFKEKVKAYVDENIFSVFTTINDFIDRSKKEIESHSSSKKSARDAIAKERAKLGNDLIDKTITKTIEQLTGCFGKDFGELRAEMLALVNQVSSNRGFINKKVYLKAVKDSEVKYISPKELLNFEALPVFKERVNEIEAWADTQLEKARINLLGLGTVCDFTLESALLMLEHKDGNSEQAIHTSLEGFDRALSHLKRAEALLHNIEATLDKDLSEAINDFDDDILKLKDTENIFDLNIKIARIRAVERTEEYKKRVRQFIVEAIPKIKEYYSSNQSKILLEVNRLKQRIGIAQPKKYVSFELSEFINQTQESLKKLPFVYQRLYRLNPTDEERFYVNRAMELDTLTKSYKHWKQDRFITVAIIGEKGSGITSLINYFLKKTRVDIKIFNHTLNSKVHTNEAYFNLFSSLFGVEKFENNEQIIEFINQSEGTKIVVLENLQHMFLKKVNGFDSMNMFFELMANTMKKVLWIGAYTKHSWNYLDKTIHISNYFTNEIYIEPLGQATIEEIIYKRNRLSGYQIIFKPDEYSLTSKKFLALNDKERQKFLRKEFFKTLHRFSSGNISLAQLYWLQSTQVASDEVIEISPINELDFSFVKNLTSDELFTMQVLIIHDGLELEDYARVMGKPISNSRNILIPMLEKGLLIRPNHKYNINPIIFRPVANYLESRNFVN
jgi:hypothetical protein